MAENGLIGFRLAHYMKYLPRVHTIRVCYGRYENEGMRTENNIMPQSIKGEVAVCFHFPLKTWN